jgi:hypothetical protein
MYYQSSMKNKQMAACFTNPSSQVLQGAVTFTGKLQVDGLQSSSYETSEFVLLQVIP